MNELEKDLGLDNALDIGGEEETAPIFLVYIYI
jgi:hypothetical protein